jgi:hypothetical protein
VDLIATANDAEDGNLTASIDWTSSIDGALGAGPGGSLTLTDLSVGIHQLTASVTDSLGLPGSAAVTFTVLSENQFSASFQNGTNGYNGMTDVKIKSDAATTRFGTQPSLETDGDPDYASLFRWDLGGVAPGSVVVDVTLTLQVTQQSSQDYEFYALNRDWVESEATWNEASSGTSWEVAGANGSGDRESTVLASINGSSIGSHNIPLGAAGIAKVQEWIDDPASNRGLVLLDYANVDGLDLRSSETGTVGERPRLTITFVPEPGFISAMMAGLSLLAAFTRRKASISSRG